MSPIPDGPWIKLSTDFAELPSGGYLLVVTDDFSRYPIVEVVRSTSANAVIPKLDHMFVPFGVLKVLRSDNGPLFNSEALLLLLITSSLILSSSFITPDRSSRCPATPKASCSCL